MADCSVLDLNCPGRSRNPTSAGFSPSAIGKSIFATTQFVCTYLRVRKRSVVGAVGFCPVAVGKSRRCVMPKIVSELIGLGTLAVESWRSDATRTSMPSTMI